MASIQDIVLSINSLERETKRLSDEKLKNKTSELKAKLSQGIPLTNLMPSAFAVVRETARRVLDMRPYDVQLIGGIALHTGRIAEMRTGEGKTLVATLPAYLNALTGQGVHVVTVNDYLAKRDAEQMGKIFNFLGLTVGVITNDSTDTQRREAYACDITYATNIELGFDYLRDNMKLNKTEFVQRGFNYAIIDEIDSILIDEARTPLIISGNTVSSIEEYKIAAAIVETLTFPEHYSLNEILKSVDVNVAGWAKVTEQEKSFVLPPTWDSSFFIPLALRARHYFRRDHDYVMQGKRVVIVDEHTGRLMSGRRWTEGVHQAVEAKEKVPIMPHDTSLATVTLQNFFRLYKKLAGMTGTALTEEKEFLETYKLKVLAIDTNKPVLARQMPDLVYNTENEKLRNIIATVKKLYARKQPVLVGTRSVAKSERLAQLFLKNGIPNVVLNAQHHEKEGEIIAQAGRLGAVTIATNMAGRGTDILLGGNPEFLAKQYCVEKGMAKKLRVLNGKIVSLCPETHLTWYHKDAQYSCNHNVFQRIYDEFKKQTDREYREVIYLGGLCVIGTERHESRRIDFQLSGRAGRQGDPGVSRFYLSLEDDLLRLYAPDLKVLEVAPNQALPADMVDGQVASAQYAVEVQNLQLRWQLLQMDDVLDKQRHEVYQARLRLIDEPLDAKPFLDHYFATHPEEKKLHDEYALMNTGTLAPKFRRLLALSIIDQWWKLHINNMEDFRKELSETENAILAFQQEATDLYQEMKTLLEKL